MNRSTRKSLALLELLTEPKGLQLLSSNLQPISCTLEPFGSNLEMVSMDDGSVNQQKVEFDIVTLVYIVYNDAFLQKCNLYSGKLEPINSTL